MGKRSRPGARRSSSKPAVKRPKPLPGLLSAQPRLFKDPCADLKRTTTNKKKKKKPKPPPIPPVPIEGCPRSADDILGNFKAKKSLSEFLLGQEHQVAIVWGANGVGKSSACHLMLRKYNMWPHTANDLQSNVKVSGKSPKMSHTMKRLVKLKPRGRVEVFFLDHVLPTCMYDPGEAKAIVNFLLSDDFRLSGRKAIVELDNLYARECREFRRLLNPVRLKNKAKVVVGTDIRFWPVPDEKIRSLLRQWGMRNEGALTRGVQLCHGDARQAVVFAKMEKTGIRCAAAADLRSNVFDACRAALNGNAEHALAAGDVQMLQALVQHNYPFQFVPEKSVWGDTSKKKELVALEAMSDMADAFSDLSCLPEAEGTAVFLASASVAKKHRLNKPACKWPSNLMFQRDLRETRASLSNFRLLTGCSEDNMGEVCGHYAEKIRAQDPKTLRWMFSHGIDQSAVLNRAEAFL